MDDQESILLSKIANKLIKGKDAIKGRLLVTRTRLTWNPNDKDAAKPHVVRVHAIKKQQQVSGKPLLRILSDADPLGLEFPTEDDKNEVLDLLKQIQPQSVKPANAKDGTPSLAEQSQIFASQKELKAVYDQLVPTGILQENEFWKYHFHEKRPLVGKGRQRLGLSSVLHEVEKLHDGKTERVNIQLTPQDIQKIFQDNPEVNRAFVAFVPHSMSEQEFWQKYFKLEYKRAARRKKLAAAGKLPSASEDQVTDKDDIFAPFREHVRQEEANAAKSRIDTVDPTLNLFAEYSDRWSGGTRVMGAPQLEETVPILERRKDDISRHILSLANEVNRHGSHVLEGSFADVLSDTADPSSSTMTLATTVEAARMKHQQKDGHGDDTEELYRYRASSGLEDLHVQRADPVFPLNIKDSSAYTKMNSKVEAVEQLEISKTASGATIQEHIQHIDSAALAPVPYKSTNMVSVLGEIATADSNLDIENFGPLGYSSVHMTPEESMGSAMTDFFRIEALKTNELLRHFWSCLPFKTESQVSKAKRLSRALHEQRDSLAAHLKPQIDTQAQVSIKQVVRPLVDCIDVALEAMKSQV